MCENARFVKMIRAYTPFKISDVNLRKKNQFTVKNNRKSCRRDLKLRLLRKITRNIAKVERREFGRLILMQTVS